MVLYCFGCEVGHGPGVFSVRRRVQAISILSELKRGSTSAPQLRVSSTQSGIHCGLSIKLSDRAEG